MKENHQRFLKHLAASNDGVWRVAQWLQQKGYPVTVNPMTQAKTRAEWKDHRDEGDLTVAMRVEVKHLSAQFTCMNDWPFKDKFIVCARHSYDQAKQKPYAYVCMNRDKTHAAIVPGSTRSKWYVEERQDRRYEGVTQEFYLCPLDQIEFVSLVKEEPAAC